MDEKENRLQIISWIIIFVVVIIIIYWEKTNTLWQGWKFPSLLKQQCTKFQKQAKPTRGRYEYHAQFTMCSYRILQLICSDIYLTFYPINTMKIISY